MSYNPYYASNTAATVLTQEAASTTTYDHVSKPENMMGSADGKGEPQPRRCNDVFFAFIFYAHLGVMSWVTMFYGAQLASSAENYGYDGGERLLWKENAEVDANILEDYDGMDAAGMPIALIIQQGVINVGNSLMSKRKLEEDGGDGEESNLSSDDILFILLITGSIGVIVSAFTLSFMMRFASILIKIALWFNILTSLAIGISGALIGAIPMALIGFIGFAFSAYYAYMVGLRKGFITISIFIRLPKLIFHMM